MKKVLSFIGLYIAISLMVWLTGLVVGGVNLWKWDLDVDAIGSVVVIIFVALIIAAAIVFMIIYEFSRLSAIVMFVVAFVAVVGFVFFVINVDISGLFEPLKGALAFNTIKMLILMLALTALVWFWPKGQKSASSS